MYCHEFRTVWLKRSSAAPNSERAPCNELFPCPPKYALVNMALAMSYIHSTLVNMTCYAGSDWFNKNEDDQLRAPKNKHFFAQFHTCVSNTRALCLVRGSDACPA